MREYLFENKKLNLILGMLLAVLSGCNSGADNDTVGNSVSPEVVGTTINAQNTTVTTPFSESYLIDLSDKVFVGDNKSFKLLDVTSLSQSTDCFPTEQSEKSFRISANHAMSCDYRYKVVVTQKQSETPETRSFARLTDAPTAEATIRVAVNSKAVEISDVTLPTISAVTSSERTIVIDVSQQLRSLAGYVVEDGFKLDEQVSLPYSTNNVAANTIADTITYTPLNDFEGIDRILFNYVNNATGETRIGTLDIAVSKEENQGFTIEDNITYDDVKINQLTTIDVTQFVTSLDMDDFQLVYVDSFNATTAPLDPTDVHNKEFTFESSSFGQYYVSFAVSDHNGAYGLGLIKITISESEVFELAGEVLFPNFVPASGELATESYTLSLADGGQQIGANWYLDEDAAVYDGLSMTADGTLTIDANKSLPKEKFNIVALPSNANNPVSFEIGFFTGIVDIVESRDGVVCEDLGYREMPAEFAVRVLNSKYRQDISNFRSSPYPFDQFYVDGRAPNVYGRLEAFHNVNGEPRADTLLRCPYPEGCPSTTSTRPSYAYDEYAIITTGAPQENALVCADNF